MRRFPSGDVPCRYCGRMTRWATTVPKGFKVLLDSDTAADGVYAVDQRPGVGKVETLARWVHSEFRERLRASEGLYREHDCPAEKRRSA